MCESLVDLLFVFDNGALGADAIPRTCYCSLMRRCVLITTAALFAGRAEQVRLLEDESGATSHDSWHTLALEFLDNKSALPLQGAGAPVLRRQRVEVRGRSFEVVDDSSDVKGVCVHCVPVSTAARAHEALQLLRQQLVLAEIFASCLAARDDHEDEDAMDTENSAANVAGAARGSGGAGRGGKRDVAIADRRDTGDGHQIVEIKAAPPASIFVYTMAGGKAAALFALICLHVEVAAGGQVSVT